MDTRFYFRYLDDMMMTVNREDIDLKLEKINRWHSNLKFTCDFESNVSEINFISLTVMRSDESKFDTRWSQNLQTMELR